MIVFELPPDGDGVGPRVASLGSCRLRNPLNALRERDEMHLCDGGPCPTHSAAEALQTLRLVRGEITISDAFAPYVFEREKSPSTARLAQILEAGVDIFLLEACDDRQFSCDGVLFQENFVSRNLVQPYRGILLSWYRDVCRGRPTDEDRVRSILEELLAAGFRPDETMASLLRGVRLRRADAKEIDATLGEMMERVGGRWVVVGAITVPGQDGAIMHDRRALNMKLEAVAGARGAAFYDPTELIEAYGRETVLDAEGANINEYAKPFHPVVGETLVSLARTGRPPVRRPPLATASGQPAIASKGAAASLVDRLNRELADLHRGRLEELGLEGSGLYAHYKSRLDQDCMIVDRERYAFDLIDAHLPAYDAYAVMRAGLGEMAFLLAAGGREVIAYEPSPTRRAAIEAGAARLRQAGLLPGHLTTVGALTPTGRLNGRVLGVGLDVAQVRTEAAAAPHMENAGAFEALLIDLRCFITLREAFADQVALAQTLKSMGFDTRRDYPAEGLYWFRRSRASDRAAAAPWSPERPATDAAA